MYVKTKKDSIFPPSVSTSLLSTSELGNLAPPAGAYGQGRGKWVSSKGQRLAVSHFRVCILRDARPLFLKGPGKDASTSAFP